MPEAAGVASTRERIARAARDLFLAKAFEDVTLASIAAAAGVSHQTVLNHFESKEGVVVAVAELLRDEVTQARNAAAPGDVAGALHALVGDYEQMGDANVRWVASSERVADAGGPPRRGPAQPPAVAGDDVRRIPAGGADGAHARHPRPARGDRRLHVEAAAPRPAPQPHRDRTNHGRPRGRHPERNPVMNESPSRRYLFALVDGGGTVPPELGAARRLVERGHHVTVLAEDSMLADVRATGAAFRPGSAPRTGPAAMPTTTRTATGSARTRSPCSPGCASASSSGRRRRTPPTPRRRSRTSGRDLVVCSFFAIGAMVAAEAAGVPFDVLFPNAYLLPARGIPPFGLGLAPARGMSGRARDRLITSITQRQWDKGVADVNTLRASYGLAPLRSFFDQVHRARRELVLTSAGFDFPGDVPANARYVGAVLDDPGWAVEPWAARRPTIARSCWSPCRRRSRTRSPACSASSTPWRRCPCTRSSRPGRRSTRRRSPRRPA